MKTGQVWQRAPIFLTNPSWLQGTLTWIVGPRIVDDKRVSWIQSVGTGVNCQHFALYESLQNCPVRSGFCSTEHTIASLTFPATLRNETSAVARCTRSKCKDW